MNTLHLSCAKSNIEGFLIFKPSSINLRIYTLLDLSDRSIIYPIMDHFIIKESSQYIAIRDCFTYSCRSGKLNYFQDMNHILGFSNSNRYIFDQKSLDVLMKDHFNRGAIQIIKLHVDLVYTGIIGCNLQNHIDYVNMNEIEDSYVDGFVKMDLFQYLSKYLKNTIPGYNINIAHSSIYEELTIAFDNKFNILRKLSNIIVKETDLMGLLDSFKAICNLLENDVILKDDGRINLDYLLDIIFKNSEFMEYKGYVFKDVDLIKLSTKYMSARNWV